MANDTQISVKTINKPSAVFSYPDPFEHRAVSGAFGGFTGSGDLFIDFFLERARPCSPETREATGQVVTPHQTMIERNVVSGVVLNLKAAKTIHAWLGQMVAAMEAQAKSEVASKP